MTNVIASARPAATQVAKNATAVTKVATGVALAAAEAPTKENITPDTRLPDGGRAARSLVWTAASEIEAISESLLKLVDDGDLGEGPETLLRMYALRMQRMNSIVLSYLADDSVTLNEVHQMIYDKPMNDVGLQAASTEPGATSVPKAEAPPPASHLSVPVDQSNFCDGRDLAIQMLSAGDALDQTDQAEPYRWMRRGAAQNRFALPFLQRLLAQPELMDGFAAVLSGRLGTGDSVHADSFALDWAEYQAGPVGGDGTATESDPAPPLTPAPAIATPMATQPTGGVPAADFDADDASLRLARARSVSWMLCQIFGNATGVAPSEIRDLEGLGGSVQHLRKILATLHAEVMAVDGELPDDFHSNLFHASSLATLVDEVEWAGQYKFMTGNLSMSEYFGAICAACEQASEAINAFEGAAA